jgi:hypothetical protein
LKVRAIGGFCPVTVTAACSLIGYPLARLSAVTFAIKKLQHRGNASQMQLFCKAVAGSAQLFRNVAEGRSGAERSEKNTNGNTLAALDF